jgi:hypothetical protein
VRPTRLIHGYPQALEAIVMKALAVEASQRYQSAGMLLEALESFAMGSRMPLSTMGLGRFMRDMFGEVQEPWLTASLSMELPESPRESTISSTNGSASVHPGRARTAGATDPDELMASSRAVTATGEGLDEPDSGGLEAAKTVLRMPGSVEPEPLDPLDQPTPALRAANAGIMATSLGVAPATAPPSSPRSASSPAIPVIASTKHGYASAAMGRADASYPRYTPPPDAGTPAADTSVKANRRPLFIGLAVVVLGVIVMIAVTVGGGTEPEPDRERAPAASGARAPAPASTALPDVADDNMVSVIVESDPPGADVLIAGSKVGTTPFNKRVKRGTKIVQLGVRKAGYVDFTGKIDLGGEYENKNIKLVPVAEQGSAQLAEPTVPAVTP